MQHIFSLILGIIIGIWVYWRSLNKQSIISHNQNFLEKSNKSNQTKKEKLEELKMIFEDQLISEDEYNKAKKKILDE